QPQLRLTVDTADHKLWLAVSAENAATTTVGTVPTSLITYNATAGSGFDTANSLSLNGTPDFVGKVAYEGSVAGRSLHVEGFALSRTFTAHLNGGYNINRAGYGFGGGAVFQAVPGKLDLQFSGIVGKGIGRYGSAQLGDVTFDANGMIHPVGEFMLLGGATFHATKRLDLYLFAGKEQETGYSFASGYGNASSTANNAGCFIEGGTCSGNTRRVQQLTTGFWNKLYSGSFGHAQVGLQYAYTQRQLFADANGIMPQVGENIGFLSFRYYPFN
ncbi:MAG TPA: hypothetical protein VFF94_04585, partial [Novosphingobium sp.]|nr:hypothetical protein [Novosphingobium sp.]